MLLPFALINFPSSLSFLFSFSFSVDVTKITEQEYEELKTKAQQDAAEAWIRREAEQNPEGHYAKEYFTKI